MSDRELLELAAKAAGMLPLPSGKELDRTSDGGLAFCGGGECIEWNPLTDDGDALRLAVQLRFELNIENYGTSVRAAGGRWYGCESHMHGGIESSTRRAIVCCAAEIGRSM